MDCVVLAHDVATGSLQWTKTWSSTDGSGLDMCKAIRGDAVDGLHVAGLTESTDDTPSHSFAMLLDHAGAQVEDIVHLDDEHDAMVVANEILGDDGAVYIVGAGDSDVDKEPVWLVRLTEAHEEQWRLVFPAADCGLDVIQLGQRGDGPLFLASTTRTMEGLEHKLLYAIDASGAVLWSDLIDVGLEGPQHVGTVVADDAGGVYWMVNLSTMAGQVQCVVRHLDASGEALWETAFGMPDHDCYPKVAVVDGDQLTIGGTLAGPGGARYFLQRLSAGTGELEWLEARERSGPIGEIRDLVVTADGHLVATGVESVEDEGSNTITLRRCVDYGGP